MSRNGLRALIFALAASLALWTAMILAVLAIAAPAAEARHRTTVIVLHGGGWTGGSPESVEHIAAGLRSYGYRAYPIRYTLGNVPQAVRDVRRAVRRARPAGRVVLYGVSAGSTLAAALAVRGRADGLVAVAGPSDLLTWRSASPYWSSEQHYRDAGLPTRDLRRRYSPTYRVTRRAAPTLVLHSSSDLIVPMDQGRALYRAVRRHQPDTRLVDMIEAGHTYPGHYEAVARKWLQARFRP